MNKLEFLTRLEIKFSDDSENSIYSKEEIKMMFAVIGKVISDGLDRDGQVRTPLGTFKKVKRKARKIRDISSGELRVLPEWDQIQFKVNNDFII
jgi:nucleoid DNA-binding protein